ncbi:PEP-CTERM sorting domain-containing protein [Thalassomonas viridans]|uniref:PEP-CTERM sorting domain-containing protein n=1 Tax=Thalassomonas viridans TaxID=137584 RepID=A0AAE9Z551_9GAMM|nr:PEP-CTERM sorting domain-containing protein [Thalassomonas viridans]WDE06234.1 PEP-CTERM sorting domain-containing protein [Thalassomonas viridans]
MKNKICLLFNISLLLTSTISQASLIKFYAPGVHSPDTAVMDAALGISGYDIEKFDDKQLMDGVSYAFINPDVAEKSQLVNLLDFASLSWDDTYVLANGNSGNNRWIPSWVQGITFFFEQGIAGFGLGFANMQSQYGGRHSLYINDLAHGTLENFDSFHNGAGRNGYLTIEAEEHEVIRSVTILSARTNADGFTVDHLAIKRLVPEPAGAALLTLGLVGAGFSRRFARHS